MIFTHDETKYRITEFDKLKVGELFIPHPTKNIIHMKIRPIDGFNAIDLSTGIAIYFQPCLRVSQVDGELIWDIKKN